MESEQGACANSSPEMRSVRYACISGKQKERRPWWSAPVRAVGIVIYTWENERLSVEYGLRVFCSMSVR